jgi:hypothetical protein
MAGTAGSALEPQGVSLVLLLFPLLSFLLAQNPANLLENPRFHDGLHGWTQSGGETAAVSAGEYGPSARIRVGADEAVGFPGVWQHVEVNPGDVLSASVRARGEEVRDGYGGYMAVNFYRTDGERISWRQSGGMTESGAWQTLYLHGVVPPETTETRLCLLLNGRGTAYFTDADLRVVDHEVEEPPGESVTLTVTDEVACESIIGFGFEDDGWFYNDENALHGLTDEDHALREERIEWLRPDWVRMFFWYKDWNPSGDLATFDFDTPNMRSKYRTLDQYQRLGAPVNVTGVEWSVPEPFADPERLAVAAGALLEHLVRAKGYTCIQYWTLTNEPDIGFLRTGATFDDFVRIHQLVREEFGKRNLAIQIVGSDEALGLPWFVRCFENEDYYTVVDLFASHRYLQKEDRGLSRLFFSERMERLRSRRSVKPLVVAEFGFQDSRASHLLNPVMEEYPYAVWAAKFAIEGLNRGVSGFSIWCLHEVYYPGQGFMNYGLWDYKDNEWRVRPVYHAWALFTRFTKRGDAVRRVESTHPRTAPAALVGNTLFWANDSNAARTVRVEGFEGRQATVLTEEVLQGERECGRRVALKEGAFEAPPMSFGVIR